MEFADFIKLPDLEKVFLIEAKVAKEIQELSWTATGAGSYWCSFTWGEALVVSEMLVSSGAITTYAEAGTIGNCDSTTSSFFYDHTAGRLYVHPSGNDSPDTASKYLILAYLCIGFTNSQFEDEPIAYEREEEALVDGDFEQWKSATSLVQWTQYIAGTSTVNRESSMVLKGEYSVRFDIDGSNSAAEIYQTITMPPGSKCRIEVNHRETDAADSVGLKIYDSGSNVWFDGSVWGTEQTIGLQSPNAWEKYSVTFDAHDDYDTYIIELKRVSAPGRSVYFDDVKVKIIRHPVYYLPYFDATRIPNLIQAVGDFHIGSIKTQFGSLAFLNDGWWYTALENFIWHNKELDVKCLAKGSDYEEFGWIFAGRMRNPDAGDNSCTIGVKDRRVGAFRQIPKNKYWAGDSGYEDLEEEAEGRVKAIPFGELTNITPVFIKTDTSTYWRFKVSEYAIESIDAVYLNGDEVDSGSITKTPASGYFDLDFDPGDGHVTCDIKGVKCDFDDDTYSDNVADILYFILNQENDFDWSKLDKVSFDDLKAGRTQALAIYLNESVSTLNFIRFLQAGSTFQFVPRPDGTYGAYRYKSGVEDDAPHLYDEDYDNLRKVEQTGATYKKVVIKYIKNPTTGNWLSVEATEEKVGQRYDEEETLTIETGLRLKAEAETLADFYLSLVHAPLAKLEGKVSSVALGFKPSDKVVVSKTIIDGEGDEVTILEDEVYRILELKKDLKTAKVGIIGFQDDQSIGGNHANVVHTNSHTDTHGDGLHENSHGNTGHSNTAHSNTHDNVSHIDTYTDHSDVFVP